MSDAKENNKDKKYTQEELGKAITQAQESFLKSKPSVSLEYNGMCGPMSTFTPSVTLTVKGGDGKYVRDLGKALAQFAEAAIADMDYPNV